MLKSKSNNLGLASKGHRESGQEDVNQRTRVKSGEPILALLLAEGKNVAATEGILPNISPHGERRACLSIFREFARPLFHLGDL